MKLLAEFCALRTDTMETATKEKLVNIANKEWNGRGNKWTRVARN